METLIGRIFISNWQQKMVAIATAVILWFFVSHSISETKIIPSVPIRVVNIPPDYTILGLLPNGILQKRITLNVTGTKDIVEDLEPGDLEVVVDASMIDHSDWVLRITKNNLVSLTSLDLRNHITSLAHTEYVIKIRPMMSEKIPITILPPTGEPPSGYEFLDIWPQQLAQLYNGAEEEIQTIKTNGLELQFDLSRISKSDLDSLVASSNSPGKDEISFYIPGNWKKLHIPCRINTFEELNDPDSDELQIDFLRKQIYPIDTQIPIRVFYPLENHDKINPDTYSLAINEYVKLKEGATVFTPKLYVHDVTKEFLNVIRDNIEIVINAASANKNDFLNWSVEIINPHALEEKYIKNVFELHPRAHNANPQALKSRTEMYRNRFQEYMQKFELYMSPEQPLVLEASLGDGKITVSSPNAG